ncbi:MAG: PASTA domain-containing protein, partial [Gemmatimonadota bacterium]
LAAALAARSTPLDRRAVAVAVPDPAPGPAPVRGGSWLAPSPGPYVFRTDAGAPARRVERERGVPDVAGQSVREAASALHSAGFRVHVDGVGRVRSMTPEHGTLARPGTVVRLTLGPAR